MLAQASPELTAGLSCFMSALVPPLPGPEYSFAISLWRFRETTECPCEHSLDIISTFGLTTIVERVDPKDVIVAHLRCCSNHCIWIRLGDDGRKNTRLLGERIPRTHTRNISLNEI